MNQANNTSSENLVPVDPFAFLGVEDVLTADLTIKDKQSGKTLMVVTLAGPEHPERKRRLMARQRRMRAALFKGGGKITPPDPEEDASEEIDDLVAYTLGWRDCPVQFSPAAARELYTHPKRQWVRRDVRAFLDDADAFTVRSATN